MKQLGCLAMVKRKKLLFISPRFLFPVSTGGQIRTTQILRGMNGGEFEITLLSPAPQNAREKYKKELLEVCNTFKYWPELKRGRFFNLFRFRHIFSKLPIPVTTDISSSGKNLIEIELSKSPDVVVFDFPHSVVLGPKRLQAASVMFTHNVESEIFRRHAKVANGLLKKYIWNNQYKKMCRYELNIFQRFDSIVAVSANDRSLLQSLYNAKNISVINTGVDLEYFKYNEPGKETRFVFTGSMDWFANIDGIEYFIRDILPLINKTIPDTSLDVVGRNPPKALKDQLSTKEGKVNFTDFVDDIRPYVYQAGIYIIPLRVGGGTRLKVFEAMAMGCPMVSTTIGVEGLTLQEGKHYLRADTPEEFTDAVIRLISDGDLCMRLSRCAREYVEMNYSYRQVAKEFESICLRTIENI